MNRCGIFFYFLCSIAAGLALYVSVPARTFQTGTAREPSPKKADDPAARAVVIKNVHAYMEAYNRKDVKAILGLFSSDCDIVEQDGAELQGLEELAAELKDTFAAEPRAQISVEMDALIFVTPDVAIETGKTMFYPDGKTLTAQTQYQVTHVRDGKHWLMRHARGFDRKVLSPYDRLRDLEWLVGDWVDESDDSLLETSYRWDASKAFLLQDFTLRVQGNKVLTGSQRIGWDPLTRQIKSWVFDSEGGNGENLWSYVDNRWIIKAKGVRSDGKIMTATNELMQMAKDRFRFESVDRIAGEERLPSFRAFAVRKPPAPKN